jgi:hypothetical protein
VPQDFFTRDLDRALLEGTADLAVHSAKDLPQVPVPGLTIAALLPARDIREAFVVRKGLAESDVRSIGTSSPRREAELRKYMPGVILKPLRGTIHQRLTQLDAGDYDALVVAACALERLGLADRITSYLPFESVPQQGRLALVVRSDRHDLIQRLLRPGCATPRRPGRAGGLSGGCLPAGPARGDLSARSGRDPARPADSGRRADRPESPADPGGQNRRRSLHRASSTFTAPCCTKRNAATSWCACTAAIPASMVTSAKRRSS